MSVPIGLRGDVAVTTGAGIIIPTGILPTAPQTVTATAGNAQGTVTFTAPSSFGTGTLTGYTVTSIPAGGTDSNAGSTGLSHVVTGLTNGTAYTFTVTCTTTYGTGPASSASNSVTPTSVTYATLDPANTGGGITLSNGNLTYANGAYTTGTRTTISKTTGKPYWEVIVNTTSMCQIGICNTSYDYTSGGLANSSGGVGIAYDGTIYYNSTQVGSITRPANGNVIGLALDIVNRTLAIYLQGVLQITLTTTLFPTTSTGLFAAISNPLTGTVTANFGQNAFVYTVPSGFSAGFF